MEKLFYSLEEAAQRLGKSADEVRKMAASGQLSEFRDRDKLMFKKEQVDLIAGGEEEGIRLADSGELEPLSLGSSGSAPSMRGDSKSDTGAINLLEDSTSDEDANAVTRISAAPSALVDPGEAKSSSGSGSAGLLDLTREADDTSLGAGLLDDVYGNETVASASAAQEEAGANIDAGGALFEGTPATDTGFEAAGAMAGAAGVAMVAAEPYDGAGSGLVGGLSVAGIVALGVAAFAMITSMTSAGSGSNSMLAMLATNWMAIAGGCAGLALIAGLLGWFLGRKS